MSNADQLQAKLAELEPAKEALQAQAKSLNADHHRKVQHFLDSNQKLVASNFTFFGTAYVKFSVFLITGTLSFEADFVGAGKLSFKGTAWSSGLTAWEGLGSAVFALPPDQLSGIGLVSVITTPVREPGGNDFTLMVYDNDGVLYGSIVGLTLGARPTSGTINVAGVFGR